MRISDWSSDVCSSDLFAARLNSGVRRQMETAAMSRQSAKQVSVNPNVRCLKVYPVEGASKTVAELKTVGLKLSHDQAIHLARVLLAVSQDWAELDILAYRTDRKSGA